MTITAVFESLEEMQEFAGKLNGGSIQGAVQEFIKGEEKIARHLHIPVQSANTTVLKNMNRPYTIAWFMERGDYIRSRIPDIFISSDVITGFPQESEEQFQDTLDNIARMRLSFLHVFPYSRRDHTAAAQMSGHLENKIKKERASRLANLSKKMEN